MMLRMDGLVKRGGVYQYRRLVPVRLRSVIGKLEWKESLDTADLNVAQTRWRAVHERVGQIFKEAEAGVKSPAILGYKALEEWRRQPPQDQRGEEGLDLHLTTLLERDDLDPIRRVVLETLLKRPEQAHEGDNPPLSILFGRYYAERKLPAKTKLEWDGVLKRFTILCGDLPVRAITQAHVRDFKVSLLSTTGRAGATLSPATVKKSLGALSSVLRWGKRNGYLSSNPAEDMTVVTGKNNDEVRRQPYSAEDLKAIFSVQREGNANHWLPWLALYTGARLEELGQLRTADVRVEDGVHFLAIEPGDGRKLKTRSSRRRIPVHPELVKLGFLAFVEKQVAEGQARLFPDLRATRFSLTAAWSKWWGRHARADCGVTDPRKTFHSFRHGWKDAARAVMPEEYHDAITGHSNGSVGRRYGTGVPLKVLAESMGKVSYPELNFSNHQERRGW